MKFFGFNVGFGMSVWMGMWLLGFALLLGCSSGDVVVDFMPGSYVNSAGSRYSVADDTLTVEHLGGQRYGIFRRTGFNLVSEGKLGPRQWETEQWRAVYDLERGILVEQRWGKELRFDPERKALEVGRREYVKLD